jgi:hypothetical protein
VQASSDYPIRVVATPLLDPTAPQPMPSSTSAAGTANTRLELRMALGT